jgi:hypothetical protein
LGVRVSSGEEKNSQQGCIFQVSHGVPRFRSRLSGADPGRRACPVGAGKLLTFD